MKSQKNKIKNIKNNNEPTHEEIIQYIEDAGYGGHAIGLDGNPISETYEDAKQELIYEKQNKKINKKQ